MSVTTLLPAHADRGKNEESAEGNIAAITVIVSLHTCAPLAELVNGAGGNRFQWMRKAKPLLIRVSDVKSIYCRILLYFHLVLAGLQDAGNSIGGAHTSTQQ